MWSLKDLLIVCAGVGLVLGMMCGCAQKNRPPVAIIKVTNSQGEIVR